MRTSNYCQPSKFEPKNLSQYVLILTQKVQLCVTNFPNEGFVLFVFQDEVTQSRASSSPGFSDVF